MQPATSDYLYHSEPFQHQHEDFIATRDELAWAILWEQGLGKSKLTCDTAAWLYAQDEIDFLLVIGPSGVHTNWITDEIPDHMPAWTNYVMAEWSSNMRKAEEQAVEAVFENFRSERKLRILAMNIEAFGIEERYYKKKAGRLARAILNTFRCMLVVDESAFIKNAGINRTRRLITLGKHAAYRRILNGTPITTGPVDMYAQYKFLSGDGPPLLGPYSTNKRSFESRYVIKEERERKDGRKYPVVVGYQNLDELARYVDQCSTRRTKKECLDLPEKVYKKLHVEMHPEQAKIYNKLRDEGILMLRDGSENRVGLAITQMMRLHQILGGFVPSTDADPDRLTDCVIPDPEKLPRVQMLLESFPQVQSGKIILYCNFIAEAKMWKDILGAEAVTFVGKKHYKNPADREENKQRFQKDDSVRYMIMNKSGARGLTLTAGTAMYYYTNGNSLNDRLQSEDRPHRIGQRNPVTYFDMIVRGTVDERIVSAYRERKTLADLITGDDPSEWL